MGLSENRLTLYPLIDPHFPSKMEILGVYHIFSPKNIVTYCWSAGSRYIPIDDLSHSMFWPIST